MMFKFECGARVKDIISGFTGIIVARTEWFNGCRRYTVEQDQLKKDGGVHEGQAFDEQQLVARGKPIKRPAAAKSPDGGPMPKVTRGHEVSRS